MLLNKKKRLALLLWLKRRRQTAQMRRWWVHPVLKRRQEKGEYNAFVQEVRRERVEIYRNYFRLSATDFERLLLLVGPRITKHDTIFRKSIPAAERLAVTLRFLATGDSFRSLAYSLRIGVSTVGSIINETCSEIWSALKDTYLRCPANTREWVEIADEFMLRWQFPNCVGAVDGKHIMIQAPKNAGSMYYNFKKRHSIVLLAVVDARYRFLVVDIGAYGRNSDGGIFSNSLFGRRLNGGTMNLPKPRAIEHRGQDLPFVFVGDAAFPLKENLMRPYSGTLLSPKKRAFNYRLSRARRMVESSFGILASQWRVFHRTITMAPENVDAVVQAACCLHNFLRPATTHENTNHAQDIELFTAAAHVAGRPSTQAILVREAFADYFAGTGAVTWQ